MSERTNEHECEYGEAPAQDAPTPAEILYAELISDRTFYSVVAQKAIQRVLNLRSEDSGSRYVALTAAFYHLTQVYGYAYGLSDDDGGILALAAMLAAHYAAELEEWVKSESEG